jgi:hypothetical protein
MYQATLATENKSLYAQECINLCQTIRDKREHSRELLDRELSGLERGARQILQKHDYPTNDLAAMSLDSPRKEGLTGTGGEMKVEGYLYDEYNHRKARKAEAAEAEASKDTTMTSGVVEDQHHTTINTSTDQDSAKRFEGSDQVDKHRHEAAVIAEDESWRVHSLDS